MSYRRKFLSRRSGTLIFLIVSVGGACVTAACGDVGERNVQVHGGPSTAPPSTECQDHTLPCAGPSITGTAPAVPVMDPARHDDTIINEMMSTTTTITLPVTR